MCTICSQTINPPCDDHRHSSLEVALSPLANVASESHLPMNAPSFLVASSFCRAVEFKPIKNRAITTAKTFTMCICRLQIIPLDLGTKRFVIALSLSALDRLGIK